MLKEFREFIAKGNMLDLAVGIVIGAAFTTIVNSFVKDLVNPFLGLFGKANFENMFLVLKGDANGATTPEDAAKLGAITLNYGAFLTAVLNFMIVAFALFLVVRASNRIKRKGEEEAATPPEPEIPNNEKLLMEIRDLLKSRA